MTKRVKTTFDLSEEVRKRIKNIAECLGIPQRDVVEIAIISPKTLEAAEKAVKIIQDEERRLGLRKP